MVWERFRVRIWIPPCPTFMCFRMALNPIAFIASRSDWVRVRVRVTVRVRGEGEG